MKIKIIFISILILISAGVYFVNFNRGAVSPNVLNDKLESTDTKAKISDSLNIESVSPLNNEDFIIKDKNNYIELGGKYGDLKTNEKVIKTVPANENHIYDIYEYDNFKILTQPGGDTSSIIGRIDLTTSIIQTSRGISIGNTISDVVEKYGNSDNSGAADSIAPGQFNYQYDGKFITFFVDKTGKVVLIRFEIV